MKYNIWCFIWDTTELVYKYTKIRILAPIEHVFKDFAPWLFGKMIGIKGQEVHD